MANPKGNMTFKCQAASAATQSAMMNFSNATSKIGELNILNSVGAGAVGQGLRTLVSASNSIRTGCGAMPTSIGSSLAAGADWVLGTVGIPASAIAAVSNINPQAANLAQGQAMQIYNKVANGNFKLSDIPGSLSDLQNLERLANGIYPMPDTAAAATVSCIDSAYAMDIVANAPKFKFLFVVQFVFNDGYGALQAHDFAFMVKKSTRPSQKFITEDVNYYNFRTKVTTKTEFEEMTMSFHDDTHNYAMEFYNAYRNALSPVTNLDKSTFFTAPESNGMNFTSTVSDATAFASVTATTTTLPAFSMSSLYTPMTTPTLSIPIAPAIPSMLGGMDITPVSIYSGVAMIPGSVSSAITGMYDTSKVTSTTTTTNGTNPSSAVGAIIPVNKYSASRGPLVNDVVGVMEQIKLYHVYDYGRMVNVYQFFNPRITMLELDELDMAASTEGNEMTLKFNYDTVYIQTGVSLKGNTTILEAGSVMPGQKGAIYPLRYNDTAGAMDGAHTAADVQMASPKVEDCGISKVNTGTVSGILNNIGGSISHAVSSIFG